MSGQLIELLIFAAIAFFIINKLISTLGTTSKNSSFFGESGSIKDVTHTGKAATVIRPNFMKQNKASLKGLVVAENAKDIESSLASILEKLPDFKPENFLKGAKMAFKMIISAGAEENDQEIEALVDKRYIERFSKIMADYGNLAKKGEGLSAHISEMYLFGNNIFVKVLFAGKGITSKVKNLHEEWTFSKNSLVSGPEWYLTNIEKL